MLSYIIYTKHGKYRNGKMAKWKNWKIIIKNKERTRERERELHKI